MKQVLEIINLPGSAANFIGNQFSYLQQHGDFEMHLICSDGPQLADFANEQKIKYKPIELNRQLTPLKDLKALRAICKYIRTNHIDVVISHQAKARLLGTTAAWLTGVPRRIVFAHGVLYETMSGVTRWLVKTNDKLVSALSTDVVCVSQFVMKTREHDHIDQPKKRHILHKGSCNGIDTKNKFNPDLVDNQDIIAIKEKLGVLENSFVVGFCGRLVKDKGVVELVDAIKMLVNKHPEKSIKLLIIGSPEKRDAIPQATLDWINNSSSVIFTGLIPYTDIQKYYLLMNVFVLPSHRDGLGMVPLEAQAMGIPAIVSKITGCAETIDDGVTGHYCDLTPESISSAVELFFDKDKQRNMGAAGRQFVQKNFERELVNHAMLDLLNGK